jgi:hypothetical protein
MQSGKRSASLFNFACAKEKVEATTYLPNLNIDAVRNDRGR